TEPRALTLRVDDVSSPVVVLARGRNEREFRPVDATWESLDASIAAAQPGTPPGRVKAIGIGSTQLRAVFGGQSTLIDVKVIGDRFRQIGEGKLVDLGKESFSIELDLRGDPSDGTLEYRI